jgi:GNAT superfamily N-acetyltransferase
VDDDWREVRRLHLKMALGFPIVVDVELNEVLATPEAFWRDYVRTCATDAHQAAFVAVDDGRGVAMGHVHVQGTAGRLDMLYVDEGHRRSGLGTALVMTQQRWAQAGGAAELVCHIPVGSAAGHLAGSLGWHRTDEVFVTRHGLQERRWTRAGAPLVAPSASDAP